MNLLDVKRSMHIENKGVCVNVYSSNRDTDGANDRGSHVLRGRHRLRWYLLSHSRLPHHLGHYSV
jgi:hypothetical protein